MAKYSGLRALVVEDEGGVALLLEDMLEELGCEVAASVPTLDKALTAATAQRFDIAVLDVNLDGQLVFPVAEILQRQSLPFVFSTGYGPVGVPKPFNEYEVLSKPFTKEELERKLRSALRKSLRTA